MEIAALLAAGLTEWIDFGVIIGILCLNATVGWYQERPLSVVRLTRLIPIEQSNVIPAHLAGQLNITRA